MHIIESNAIIASEIITEAAAWLIENNKPLWTINQLTPERLLQTYSEDSFYVGWKGNIAVCAMVLLWHDPYFWPHIPLNESGFIHKLSVKREFSGMGYPQKMIKYAEEKCIKRDIKALRLDCAGDRPELCQFYENYGFIQIDRKKIGEFDVALFEKHLIS